MTAKTSENIQKRFGWCPNAPSISTTPTELTTTPAARNSAQPDGGDGGQRRISRGINLASDSIKTLINNKQLLWFSFLAGLVILLMTLAEIFLIIFMLYSGNYSYWSLGYKPGLVLTFAIEMISIFCFNFLLAGLILSLNPKSTGQPVTVREGLSRAKSYVQSITMWSFILALFGTAIQTIIVHHPYYQHIYPVLGSIISIPFIYYIPTIVLSALNFVFIKMFINVFLFILTLFVIPVLVLENKNLPDAVMRSILFFKKTWTEIIVCFFIFGLILFGISLLAPFIGMTPAFVDYDYHFFSAYSIEMATVCILFLLGWWIATVIGFTVAGIAIQNIYTLGKTGHISGEFNAPPSTSQKTEKSG